MSHYLKVMAVLGLAGCADDTPVPMMEDNGVYYRVAANQGGTYLTYGSDQECNWERLTDPNHPVTSVVESGSVPAGKDGRVRLNGGEYFMFHGCHRWFYAHK